MSVVAGHQKLTAISWEHYWCWFSYSYVRSCWRTQHQPFYSLRHLKKIGKVRKLGKWVRHELTADKKKSSFWSVVFSYSVHQQWTISPSDCDKWQKVDFMWQLVMTSSTVGPRRSSKALSKAKLAPKKGHGQCLMVVWWSADSLIQYRFLNPSETIVPEKYAQQIDENYRKLQCLQLALINREGPGFQQVAQPVLQKLN